MKEAAIIDIDKQLMEELRQLRHEINLTMEELIKEYAILNNKVKGILLEG